MSLVGAAACRSAFHCVSPSVCLRQSDMLLCAVSPSPAPLHPAASTRNQKIKGMAMSDTMIEGMLESLAASKCPAEKAASASKEVLKSTFRTAARSWKPRCPIRRPVWRALM